MFDVCDGEQAEAENSDRLHEEQIHKHWSKIALSVKFLDARFRLSFNSKQYYFKSSSSSEINTGDCQGQDKTTEFTLNTRESRENAPKRRSSDYGAWYLKPKKWNDFYEGSKKKKSISDDTQIIKQPKEYPLNATARAFDQFIKDNKLYKESCTIKEILH